MTQSEDVDVYLHSLNGKIIHQVWFGTIPNKRDARKAYEKMRIYRESWTLKNPGWFRFEWDKKACESLVKSFYPEHWDMYRKYKHEIQRCDVIRYMILHRYGGWYADMDYFCNRPLNDAMAEYGNDIYFVQSPNNFGTQDADHISNSLMYSVRGHSYWKQVMIDLEKAQTAPYYYGKHLTVMFTTGPGILNRVYSRYKYRYKVKSLPWKFFHPYGISDEKLTLNLGEDIFAVHIGKGSWEEKDSKILLFFARSWGLIVYILVMMIFPSLVVSICSAK